MVCLTTTTSTAESRGNASRYVGATSPAQPELLAEVGLFADLTTVELVGLAKLMRPRAYARDEVIYLRGDAGTAFYVIASGRVKIALTSPDGKEIILRRLGPGGFHGELALLDDEPRSADAIATEPSVLLVLQRDAFRRFRPSIRRPRPSCWRRSATTCGGTPSSSRTPRSWTCRRGWRGCCSTWPPAMTGRPTFPRRARSFPIA